MGAVVFMVLAAVLGLMVGFAGTASSICVSAVVVVVVIVVIAVGCVGGVAMVGGVLFFLVGVLRLW